MTLKFLRLYDKHIWFPRLRTYVTSTGQPLCPRPRHSFHCYCRLGGARHNFAALVQRDASAHDCCVFSTRAGAQDRLKSPPDFGNVRDSYRDTTTSELLRAYVILSFCSSDFLVSKIVKILGWTRRLLGGVLYRAVMKRTIYGQFLAGENDAEILAVAERNLRRGVNAMMAYIARETHGAGGEGRGKCPRRPTLDIYQTNFDAVRHSIDLAADVTSKTGTNQRQLAAAKLTFLVSTEILRHLSDLVTKNTSIVSNAYRQSSAEPVKMKALVELLNDICRQARQCSYDFLIPPATSNMEKLDTSLTTNIAFHLTCSKTRDLSQFTDGESSPVTLSSSEEIQLNQVWKQMCALAEHAESCRVVFVWDAEQTYLQPAIDLFVFDLMRRYNRRRVVVFHTYQCYLKSTYEKIIRDLELSRKEDFCLAAKLVRGAYLKEVVLLFFNSR